MSIRYNVKFYTVLTPKMISESLNCGSILDKIYLRLNENVLEISLKWFTTEYDHLRPEVQATLMQFLEVFML